MAHTAYFKKSMKAELDRKEERKRKLIEKRDALTKEIEVIIDEQVKINEMLNEGSEEIF